MPNIHLRGVNDTLVGKGEGCTQHGGVIHAGHAIHQYTEL
jgi:hypothetical protein